MKKHIAISALVVLGAILPQARANQIIFLFNSPLGNVGSSETYTQGGFTLTAKGYNCGQLCAGTPNTNYSANPTSMYANSDGLGMANNFISSTGKYEIPNTEFIQLDFSYILANANVSSIQYKMVDIVTAWSSFASTTAGVLRGSGGAALVTDSASSALQTITNPTYALYSFVAGTNCDVVLNEIIVNYTPITIQAVPEPATMLLSGLVLLGLGVGMKRLRRTA